MLISELLGFYHSSPSFSRTVLGKSGCGGGSSQFPYKMIGGLRIREKIIACNHRCGGPRVFVGMRRKVDEKNGRDVRIAEQFGSHHNSSSCWRTFSGKWRCRVGGDRVAFRPKINPILGFGVPLAAPFSQLSAFRSPCIFVQNRRHFLGYKFRNSSSLHV